MTRLADLTGLDQVGVPVFHAVRPRSRGLCVHQGKGFTRHEARLGALMEAVECHRAETFRLQSRPAPVRGLPPGQRPADLADFACVRTAAPGPDEPMTWTAAERIGDGSVLQVPFDCVNLDYAQPWDFRLDHSSNGLAARFDLDGAILKGLLEVIERDAAAAWSRLSSMSRATTSVARPSIPFPWFGDLTWRLQEAGLSLAIHHLPALVGLPVFHAEVSAADATVRSARARGWACDPDAGQALRGAVLEALQCRLTLIVGARDDILHGVPCDPPAAFPLPPGLRGRDWSALALPKAAQSSAARVAAALAGAGYPDAAFVRLSAPDDAVCVVKVFVPGLGAEARERRPAAGSLAPA